MRQQLCVKHLRQNPIRGDEILRRSFLVDSSFIKPQSWSIEKTTQGCFYEEFTLL